MTRVEAFGGWGLALGAVRGLRGWNANADGLSSVAQRAIWKPGENVAHCLKSMCDCHDCRTERDLARLTTPHQVETCQCGFYAYFADGVDLATDNYVKDGTHYIRGIIEGYGQTVVGTKGFRAQKARVLALCLQPAENPGTTEDWKLRYVRDRRAHAMLIASEDGIPLFDDLESMLAEYPTSSKAEFEPVDDDAEVAS